MLIYILLFSTFFPQDTIHVQVRSHGSKFQQFEKEFITDIVTLYNGKYEKKYTVNFHETHDFKDLFKFNQKYNTLSISAITLTEERKKNYNFSIPYFPVTQALLTIKKNKAIVWKKKDTIFGYIKNDIHHETILKFKDEYQIKIREISPVDYAHDQINTNVFQVFISDITSGWSKKNKLIVLDYSHPF